MSKISDSLNNFYNIAVLPILRTQYVISAERTLSADNISQARSALSACTDGNGSVLAGGGTNADGTNSSIVDKYDLTLQHYTMTALSSARCDLSAAKGADGSVLFAGGYSNRAYLGIVDKYDLSGVHSNVSALSQVRSALGAATNGAGCPIFAGGSASSGTVSTKVDKYSEDYTRTSLTDLPYGMPCRAAVDGNGSVVVCGHTKAYRYDTLDTLTTLPEHPISVGEGYFAMAADGNGNVIISGDGAAYRYDKTGTLTTLASPHSSLTAPAGAADSQGNVIIGGGGTYVGGVWTYTASDVVEQYDLYGTKTTRRSLNTARMYLACAASDDGNVFFIGGLTNYKNRTTTDVTDILSENVVNIDIPPASFYKFAEHNSEQFTLNGTSISVARPNSGYIRKANTINI